MRIPGRRPEVDRVAETTAARPLAGFGSVLGVREFRWLWAAGVQSLLGDQLARVALSVLVFRQTGSALWTGLVYALTFLPALVGGVVFSGAADRYPRREVLIVVSASPAAARAITNPASTSVSNPASSSGPSGARCSRRSRSSASGNPHLRLHPY